ncbi:small ribosomal subunit Rsm22 family protein [Halocalculus aciditolerans]|uniref:Class I SAM-dependent methyltransferase n=1 Tax=Halocalculus aciditolerans TaxID=1383812 RepID=A0A830FHT7_9EURY|nr:class I SAM-dependent methyltransferase [Halocalculus aciditolerans]GGL54114.1 hypothetical protein GCM10009039_10360 [Halocalculus aciditolerans]
MPVDRDAVVSNAKYLRNIRPVDPDEISEYVEGHPHGAVVRQVLREEAWDLGLVEREDGTFVPADDDPVRIEDAAVEGLPSEYAAALEGALVERYGGEWYAGATGDTLRESIRRLKEDYYHENPVEYDLDAAFGYALYHLPDFYAAGRYVFADLARDGRVPRTLRVLDVGAGVGGPALGLLDALPEDALVRYEAVEPSASTELLDLLLDETGTNVHPSIHETTAEAFDPGTYDIVLFGNVLSELDAPVAVVEKYLDALDDDGTLVAIAPADKNTAIQLREVEREVEANDSATVFAPAVRLWEGYAPTDTGWSFDERPDVEPPRIQRELAERAERPSEFLNETVKFAYSFLTVDGERRYDVSLSPGRTLRMADSGDRVTNRVDALVGKLSRNLAGGDANPLFRVSDGSERVDHYAVLVQETSLNVALRTAEYGDLLSVESALLLWNDDEGAYNLVVDDETVVDPVPR